MNIYHHKGVFENNSATIEYYSIIEYAKSQSRKKLRKTNPDYQYFESHHVLPKALFHEYKKDKWNIVLLTAVEHLTCHKLLLEMTTGIAHHKMVCAYWKMAASYDKNMQRVEMTPEEYRESRELFSATMSVLSQRPCAEETKKLIGKANSGRPPSIEAVENSIRARKGKSRPAAAVKASADAQRGNTNTKGFIWWNDGINVKFSKTCPGDNWKRGRIGHSEETKRKIGIAGTGRVQTEQSNAKRREKMTDYVWPADFGEKISASKLGVKTQQQEIMGRRYSAMSELEFEQHIIKMKSLLVKNRATNLRNKWLKKSEDDNTVI